MDTQTSFSTHRSGKSRWLALLALVLAPTAFAAEAKEPPSFDRTLGFINETAIPSAVVSAWRAWSHRYVFVCTTRRLT